MKYLISCFEDFFLAYSQVLYRRILPGLVVTRFFPRDGEPEKELKNEEKMKIVLHRVEEKLKKEDDGTYFWKFMTSLENYYPELVYDTCAALGKKSYHCEEIQMILESHRISFILLRLELRVYIQAFTQQDLFYREDLHELTPMDYAKLIANETHRKKFLEEIEGISNFSAMTNASKNNENAQQMAKPETDDRETKTNFLRFAKDEIDRILELGPCPDKLLSYLQQINNVNENSRIQSLKGC